MTRRSLLLTRDLVVVVALVGIAEIGLGSTFQGWGHLVLAVAAAVLGVGVVLATLRLPVVALLAVVPLVAIVLGGPMALHSSGLGGGVPDAQTLADVMRGSVTGWSELLTTLPGVDLAGPPAMVPFLLGYLGALAAAVLVLRSRSVGGPLLPLLGVLVTVLLLRRPQGGLQDSYPVAFALLAIAWLGVRGLQLTPERGHDVRGQAQGRLARGLTAAVVVVTAVLVALPLTAGTATSQGEALRGRVGALLDVSGLDSPLKSFRSFTKQAPGALGNVHRKLLLVVSGAPVGSRVRLLTLDRYDGRAWTPGNDTMTGTTDDRFQRMDTLVQNPTRGRQLRVQVRVARAYRSAWVPTVGSLTSLRFLYDSAQQLRDQLRYDLATSTAVAPLGLADGDDYEFTAIQPDERLGRWMRPWPQPLLHVAHLRGADRRIRDVLRSPAPPMRKVFALATYLHDQGRYSNGVGPAESQYLPGHDVARLFGGFLLAPRPVGDDEQYAAAMALLANRVGVPARVVVGAVVPRDGKVRGSDVSAWVEVRVADGTWRTLPTEVFMSHRPPRRETPPAPRPSGQLGGAAATPPPASPPPPPQIRSQHRPAHDLAARRSLLVRALPWLLLLLLALAIPVAKLVRRRWRRTRGRTSDRIAGGWAELVDHARDLGVEVPPVGTRPAQARRVSSGLPTPEQTARLARQADDGAFAPVDPPEEAAVGLWREVMSLRRTLSGAQLLRRRLWAPFNPVTLVRRSSDM